jgi:dihydropteroate synthase
MSISDEAVEAAANAIYDKDLGYRVNMSEAEAFAEAALKAAAPHLLSHERQQTADAHRDAIVNRDTVDRLEQELQRAKAEAWDEGHLVGSEDYGRALRKTPNPYRSAEAGE